MELKQHITIFDYINFCNQIAVRGLGVIVLSPIADSDEKQKPEMGQRLSGTEHMTEGDREY